jgi:CubicO group peptidase (beta-lactamase class C family)
MKLLIGLLALILTACPSVDEPVDDDDDSSPPPELDAEDLPEEIAAAFADEADGAGAAIAIYHRGTLYAGAVGTKDPDGGDPIEPTTLFRIGSTTKMMTSTAVLAAADRGDLTLDDPVVEHLPGLDLGGAAPFEDVTLHHLLSHTSGINEITPIDGGEDDDRLQDFTFGGFSNTSYMMAPAGAFWNYSNPNFSLAGAAIEATDGRSYRDIMAEDVWGPLGMHRSFFLGSEVAADGDFAQADTYDWTGQSTATQRVGAESYDDAWSRPAGFAWSSVLDMIKWGRFLLDGNPDVVSESSHGELVAEHANMHAYRDYGFYGYGVIRFAETSRGDGWYAIETAEHNGAIPGYAADILTVPAEDFVVVTLAAKDGGYFGDTIQTAFEELLEAEAIDLPDAGIVDDDLSRYVGTYQDPANVGPVIVTLGADGQLDWEMPRLDTAGVPYLGDLTQTSRGNFFVNIQNAPTTVTFLAEDGSEEGPTRWLRHRAFVADRGEERGQGDDWDVERLRAFAASLSGPML